IVVEISLARDRPVGECRMRGGALASAASIGSGLLAIEVKQHSRECFEIAGPEIFPAYGRAPSTRSVGKQVADSVVATKQFLKRYSNEPVFVHGLGWLTDMPERELAAMPDSIVGREATWSSMLQAAATRQPMLFDGPPAAYREAIASFGNVLAKKRRAVPHDRAAVDRLTNATIANGKFADVREALGSRQVRLVGRAGSGKSTTLALIADYVARVRQERLLVLTYHHALAHEIDRLVRSIVDDDSLVDRHVRVATLIDFLGDACTELGGDVPRIDGRIDYAAVDDAFRRFLAGEPIERLREDAAVLKEVEPDRFDFDYVCVDEAQDCLDTERDLLRVLYPAERFVLADGLEQLVRRQVPCDWTTGIKPAARLNVELGQSLRMSRNVAEFVTAMADAMGLRGWRLTAHPELSGGRIIVVPHRYDRPLFEELMTSLDAANVARKDLLVCVPPSEILKDGLRRDAHLAEALRSWGYAVWNGCDDEIRRSEIAADRDVRVIQYSSMRGLEGWYTVLVALDDSYTHRVAHPNIRAGDSCTPEDVAKRWLLMALTRAAQTLVITLEDPASIVGQWLRQATKALPPGVVEWRESQ
ncbi:MAG TPA: hypothetical protein VIJ77_04295, partial [Candidatus Tumulicola sp.]